MFSFGFISCRHEISLGIVVNVFLIDLIVFFCVFPLELPFLAFLLGN